MTRAEHHADSDKRTVRESRRIVRDALETHAIGRDNAMTGKELTALVPIAYTTVRDVISELRDDTDGLPIGDCGDGYFVIETEDELDDWVRGRKESIANTTERMMATVSKFNKRK